MGLRIINNRYGSRTLKRIRSKRESRRWRNPRTPERTQTSENPRRADLGGLLPVPKSVSESRFFPGLNRSNHQISIMGTLHESQFAQVPSAVEACNHLRRRDSHVNPLLEYSSAGVFLPKEECLPGVGSCFITDNLSSDPCKLLFRRAHPRSRRKRGIC